MIERSRIQEAMRDFYVRSQRLLDRISAAHGASSARLRLMMHIASRGSVRSADLIEVFGFAPRTVTEAIDSLEADGLAERRPDPLDRRAKRIFLTAAGDAVLKAIDPIRQKFADHLFAALNDQEQEQLTALVSRLNLCLQELEENIEEFSASANE